MNSNLKMMLESVILDSVNSIIDEFCAIIHHDINNAKTRWST